MVGQWIDTLSRRAEQYCKDAKTLDRTRNLARSLLAAKMEPAHSEVVYHRVQRHPR